MPLFSLTNVLHHWLSEAVIQMKRTGSRAVNYLKILWGAEEAVFLQLGNLLDSSAGRCHCVVSIIVSNDQCKLLNAMGSLTECMHTKYQAFSFAPGVEASNHAATHSEIQTARIERVRTTDFQNRHSHMELHVKGFISKVKCVAMNCPWDYSILRGLYEHDEWSVMPWNVHEITPHLTANVSISSRTTSSASKGTSEFAKREMENEKAGSWNEWTMGSHHTIASNKKEA